MSLAQLKFLGKVGGYILLPFVFLCVPTSWFEGGPTFCLFRRILGRPCPGCGMTRALSCVLHGDLQRAFTYNRLVVVVFPLLCWTWFRSLTREIERASALHHPS